MASNLHNLRIPAQSTALPLDSRQVKNNSGAYVYTTSDDDRFKRFLIIGTDGGSYYQSEQAVASAAATFVFEFAVAAPTVAAELIAWGAKNAPRRTYALYALAVLTTVPRGVAAAREVFADVIGNGTDLLEFVAYADGMRGWGRGLKSLVSDFLTTVDGDRLALWGVKYRNRHGWSWADVLRKAHPTSSDADRNAVLGFLADKPFDLTRIPNVVVGYKMASTVDLSRTELADVIRNTGLPWEALTDEQRTDEVWAQLVTEGNLGNVALLRNLTNLTRRKVLKPLSAGTVAAHKQLTEAKNLHPLKILEALKVYSGKAPYFARYGSGRTAPEPHKPVPMISSALEMALVNSFTRGVRTTGKAIYYAVDVSGSMSSPYSGSDAVSCCEAAAAIALGSVKNETNTIVKGFARNGGTSRWGGRDVTGMVDLGFTPTTTFPEAVRKAQMSNFGGTDASLPFKDALDNGYVVDAFVVITDNETNGGTTHVKTVLAEYRRKVNPRAKLIVIGMSSTPFTIADPTDPLCINIAGFSADTPALISAFVEL